MQQEVRVIRSSAGSKSRHRSHSPGSHPLSSFSFPTRSSTLLAPLLRRFYLSAPRLPNLSTLCLVFSPLLHAILWRFSSRFHSVLWNSIFPSPFDLSLDFDPLFFAFNQFDIRDIIERQYLEKFPIILWLFLLIIVSHEDTVDVTKERREKVVKKSSFQIQDFIT